MATSNLKRFYPQHPVGKPVDPQSLNNHNRFILDNLYDVQQAVSEMTGGGTALAQIAGGIITAIVVMYPGFGYGTAPSVTISGDGSGAKAEATVLKGRITAIKVTNGGSGYTTATVTIT